MINEAVLLIPAFRSGRETPWAGDVLRRKFQKYTMGNSIGESYDFSTLENLSSSSASGEPLSSILANLPDCCVNDVPLLIKWIDAARSTSIHLHPGHDEYLFITNITDNAEIIIGLSDEISGESLEANLNGNNDPNIRSTQLVQPGDFLRIPAGVPHAIRGITCLSVHHPDALCYRLCDMNQSNLKAINSSKISEAIQFISHDHVTVISTDAQNQILLQLTACDAFDLYSIRNAENYTLNFENPYCIITCITPCKITLQSGKKFYLPAGQTFLASRASAPFSFTCSSAFAAFVHV